MAGRSASASFAITVMPCVMRGFKASGIPERSELQRGIKSLWPLNANWKAGIIMKMQSELHLQTSRNKIIVFCVMWMIVWNKYIMNKINTAMEKDLVYGPIVCMVVLLHGVALPSSDFNTFYTAIIFTIHRFVFYRCWY